MSEANSNQPVAIEQQTTTPVNTEVKASEASNQDVSSVDVKTQETISHEPGKPDPELAKQRFKDSENKRRREIDELRRQLEQEKAERARLQQIASNPMRDGEIYDEMLGEMIPVDLPVTEYKEKLAIKNREIAQRQAAELEQRKNEELIQGFEQNISYAKQKNPNVEIILRNAVQDGLLDLDIFEAVADRRAGRTEEDILFLVGLVEKNPDLLKKVMAEPTTHAKAVKIGEIRASYLNKPAPRINNLPPPVEPLSSKGVGASGVVSVEDTDDGFRQRKMAYLYKK